MVNLEFLKTNTVIIWANCVDDFPLNNFLFEFINGFTQVSTFVKPIVVKKNRRFIEFSIEVTNPLMQDPINGRIFLAPVGNWDYKLYNSATSTLDPTGLTLIDTGQMQLFDKTEVDADTFVYYISDNENGQAVVYVEKGFCPIWGMSGLAWGNSGRIWGDCIPTCEVWNLSQIIPNTSMVVWNEC